MVHDDTLNANFTTSIIFPSSLSSFVIFTLISEGIDSKLHEKDILVEHGKAVVEVERDFESICNWLNEHAVEGLVFWLDGEPVCKIKRKDFGWEWPVKNE